MDHEWQARNKNDLIIEVWEHLDCESVGANELAEIQEAVRLRLGPGAVDSPARIARLLADEGAVLRHPEILEFDSEWRLQSSFIDAGELNFSTLFDAANSMRKVEVLRKNAYENGDKPTVTKIRDFILEVKDDLLLQVHNRVGSDVQRSEAKEILGWLAIWQRSPELFSDWLDLRLNSPGFRQNFPDFRL